MRICYLAAFLFLISCSPKIVSYVNPRASFKKYETYRLVTAKLESKNISSESTRLIQELQQMIHSEMQRRNYQPSNVSPDLTLRYELTSSTRVETNNNMANPLFFPMTLTSRTIYESVLLLELTNEKGKLVWQGSYDLGQERKEKKALLALKNAVGYTFTSYPYQSGSGQEVESLKTYKKKKKDD